MKFGDLLAARSCKHEEMQHLITFLEALSDRALEAATVLKAAR
jgi:hypothetical protein